MMPIRRAAFTGRNNQGFSLIEMMVTLSLIGIIAAGFVTSFTGQQEVQLSAAQVGEMQQNARSALSTLTREIRMAGYDPHDGASGAGITNAGDGTSQANAFTFTYVADDDNEDNDLDSITDEEGELKTISFFLFNSANWGNNTLGMLDSTNNGVVDEIAVNLVNDLNQANPVYLPSQSNYIPTFNFYYYNSNMVATTNPGQVAFVRVNLVTQVDPGETDYTLNTATRTITTLVRCRNLNLN